MFYPDYVWMLFNWYTDDWWLEKSSCAKNATQAKKLERLVETSLVLDHYPRIDEKDKNKTNIGKIVSIYYCIAK